LAADADQADLTQALLDPLGELVRAQLGLLAQRERDVVEAGQRVEERAPLKDYAVVPAYLVHRPRPELGDVGPIDHHLAAIGAEQAEQMLEEDGLATAAAPDDHGDGAIGHVEVDTAEDGLARERLREPPDFDHRLASPSAAARTATITGESSPGSSPRRGSGRRRGRRPGWWRARRPRHRGRRRTPCRSPPT